jgi:hypothetical protein
LRQLAWPLSHYWFRQIGLALKKSTQNEVS